MGSTERLAWPPNVVANEAARAMRSTTTSDETLSRSRPPYCSGAPSPSRPSSPHFLRRARDSAQSLASSFGSAGTISASTNSAVVCAMRRCSSVSFSGVKVSPGSSKSQDPPLICLSAVVVISACLHSLENSRRAHAATDAHRHQAIARVAPPHFVEHRSGQLRAGAAERVAERDRAAVHVQASGIDRQLAQAREHLRRESLVELHQIHLLEREAGELQRLADGGHR